MLEVADIVRLHGAAFRARFSDSLLPSQRRALSDIQDCRTARFGGHVKQCDHCGGMIYAYHSCRNRHCPKCHGDQTRDWLDRQGRRLLPCPFYLVTFTLPAELRALAFANQRKVYGALMRCAAAALQKLAADPRWLGGRLGCLAVLHTWTRALLYHPHVHLLVTAGGLPPDGSRWLRPRNPAFLVPVRALSLVFRGKLRAALKKEGLLERAPAKVWRKKWVVHCQPAGSGEKALGYLGRYVHRVALANSRLELIEGGRVTFRYRDSRTTRMRRITLPAVEFLRRFLQHALPKGCVKVRYSGIWSHSSRQLLDPAQTSLEAPPSVVDRTDSANPRLLYEIFPPSLPPSKASGPTPLAQRRPRASLPRGPNRRGNRLKFQMDLVQPRILSRLRATRILNSLYFRIGPLVRIENSGATLWGAMTPGLPRCRVLRALELLATDIQAEFVGSGKPTCPHRLLLGKASHDEGAVNCPKEFCL